MLKDKKQVEFEQPSDFLLIINKYILVIVGIVVIVILSLGYLFFLKPKLEGIRTTQDESTETQERKLQNENLLTKIKELKNEYEDIKNNRSDELDKLKKIVPYDPQIAEIFVSADRLALEKGFKLVSINITESKEQVVSKNADQQPQFEQTGGLVDPEIQQAEILSNVDSLTLDSYSPKSEDVIAKIGLKFLTIHISLVRIKDEAVVDQDLLDRWGLSDEEKDEFMQNLRTNLTLQPYGAFKNYLSALEYHLRLSDVNSVSFSAFNNENSGGGEGTSAGYGEGFNIDVTTYFREKNE